MARCAYVVAVGDIENLESAGLDQHSKRCIVDLTPRALPNSPAQLARPRCFCKLVLLASKHFGLLARRMRVVSSDCRRKLSAFNPCPAVNHAVCGAVCARHNDRGHTTTTHRRHHRTPANLTQLVCDAYKLKPLYWRTQSRMPQPRHFFGVHSHSKSRTTSTPFLPLFPSLPPSRPSFLHSALPAARALPTGVQTTDQPFLAGRRHLAVAHTRPHHTTPTTPPVTSAPPTHSPAAAPLWCLPPAVPRVPPTAYRLACRPVRRLVRRLRRDLPRRPRNLHARARQHDLVHAPVRLRVHEASLQAPARPRAGAL